MLPVENTPTEWPVRFTRRLAGAMCWRVSDANLEACAEWVGSTTWARGVIVPVIERGKPGERTANVGDWIVREGDTFRVVADADFAREFVPMRPAEMADVWAEREAVRRAGL